MTTSVNLDAERRVLYSPRRLHKFFTAIGTINHSRTLFEKITPTKNKRICCLTQATTNQSPIPKKQTRRPICAQEVGRQTAKERRTRLATRNTLSTRPMQHLRGFFWIVFLEKQYSLEPYPFTVRMKNRDVGCWC